jgi:hypothetical protein
MSAASLICWHFSAFARYRSDQALPVHLGYAKERPAIGESVAHQRQKAERVGLSERQSGTNSAPFPGWYRSGKAKGVLMHKVLIVVLLLGLVGCAGQPVRFTHSSATQEKFLQDRYACYQETAQRVSTASIDSYGGGALSEVKPNCSAFRACLAARGYLQAQDGNLEVPASAKIECK